MSTSVSPKVTASTAMLAASTILFFLLREYAGVELPDAVEFAVVVVLTFLAGYLKTDPARS